MRFITSIYFAVMILMFFFSCKSENRYQYAIRDFRKPIQGPLISIVSKGVVMYFDSTISYSTTDKELVKLSQSENPSLRGMAVQEMLERRSFNHYEVIMNHLDDTAMVATEAGEFGIYNMSVSDFVLAYGKWKSMEAKNKTIHE